MSTYRLPAEYEPQLGVWLTWPGNPRTWRRCRDEALAAHARLTALISRIQPVDLICPAPWRDEALKRLKSARANTSRITLHDWPVNDAWCRDHGPLFVKTPDGSRAVMDLPYNAWGGKFPPWEDDDEIARRVSELRNLPHHRLPIIGEGGAIEVNSQGVLITTESVWLNPNRNPDLTKSQAEKVFADFFGVRETLWLPEGLRGDDTDGHVDNLARFVNDTTVVTVLPDEDDPNHDILQTNHDLLAERFDVAILPHPRTITAEGWSAEVLPASYANFLILNDAVLVPAFQQPTRDEDALHTLFELFPGREIIPVDCTDFIWEGGAIHCLTMQETA